MNTNRLRWFLLFLLVSAVFQLLGQQTEADRKLLAGVCAKAQKGDAQSQYELGSAFDDGSLGVAEDEAEAVKWYRKAAEQNDALAQNKLAGCYYKGEGVAVDSRGNVYIAAGQVHVYNPAGKLIDTIAVPERPLQLVFGGADHQTLFVPARTSLYSVRTRYPGR